MKPPRLRPGDDGVDLVVNDLAGLDEVQDRRSGEGMVCGVDGIVVEDRMPVRRRAVGIPDAVAVGVGERLRGIPNAVPIGIDENFAGVEGTVSVGIGELLGDWIEYAITVQVVEALRRRCKVHVGAADLAAVPLGTRRFDVQHAEQPGGDGAAASLAALVRTAGDDVGPLLLGQVGVGGLPTRGHEARRILADLRGVATDPGLHALDVQPGGTGDGLLRLDRGQPHAGWLIPGACDSAGTEQIGELDAQGVAFVHAQRQRAWALGGAELDVAVGADSVERNC